jgi:xanthine phosphoribosyltransferase
MRELIDRINTEARYLGNGIVKVDSFLNHRIDTILMTHIGRELARQLEAKGIGEIDKVLTAETSGIPPALTTAQALGVPLVYARKKRPATLVGDCYQSATRSHTKGEAVVLHVSTEYLSSTDRVILVDDFIGFGDATEALLDIIGQSGATLCGIGYVLEKVYEKGRERLAHLDVPVIALARIDVQDEQVVVVE